jgi:hypothetical protein
MEKIITRVKTVRYNWWEAFKEFMSLPGYKYYKPPPELKIRYPAPGSHPRSKTHIPSLYKKDWKLPFIDSPLNVRAKEKIFDRTEGCIDYKRDKRHELNPEREMDRIILEGPVRNRDREPDESTYFLEDIFNDNMTREQKAEMVKEAVASISETVREKNEWANPAMSKYIDDCYEPEYLMFYKRGAAGHVNEARIRNMYAEITFMIEEIYGKERIETKEMDMYRGTVKKWQVLDDEGFSRDQIEKIQSAIKAPSPAELEWFKEESVTKMTLPISNKNVSDWRDKKRAIDSADFNAKLVEFERHRNENFFVKRYDRPKQLD